MPKLNLLRDPKNGEPVRKKLVSARKAKMLNYLAITAYDNKRKARADRADIGEK